MRSLRFSPLALLSLLLLPLGLAAQGPGPGQNRQGMGPGGGGTMIQNLHKSPAGLALEHRDELQLRPDQVEALEGLNRAWLETNEPHLAVVRQLVEQAQAQGGRMGGGGMPPQAQGRPGMQGQSRGPGARGGPPGMTGAQEAIQGLMQSRQAQLTNLGDILSANQLRELRQKIGPAGPGGAQAQRLQPSASNRTRGLIERPSLQERQTRLARLQLATARRQLMLQRMERMEGMEGMERTRRMDQNRQRIRGL